MGLHAAIRDAFSTNHAILAKDTARHVGDRVALVVAETPDRARDAAEAVVVDYEVLPAVSELARAREKGRARFPYSASRQRFRRSPTTRRP